MPDQGAPSSVDGVKLYASCRSGDRLVQGAAFQDLWTYLYKVALHVVGDQPEAEALAQDCAQAALVEVYTRLAECRVPAAFHAWARRIAAHKAIDELRRRRRLVRLENDEEDTAEDVAGGGQALAGHRPSVEASALGAVGLEELRRVITRAPISGRSRRAVLGRYLDDLPDESIAQAESELAGEAVRPSHVQVTRAKDIARLRTYEPLRSVLGIVDLGL